MYALFSSHARNHTGTLVISGMPIDCAKRMTIMVVGFDMKLGLLRKVCRIPLHDGTIERGYSVPEERPKGNGPYELNIRGGGCQMYGVQAGEGDLRFESGSKLLE